MVGAEFHVSVSAAAGTPQPPPLSAAKDILLVFWCFEGQVRPFQWKENAMESGTRGKQEWQNDKGVKSDAANWMASLAEEVPGTHEMVYWKGR